MPKQEPTISVIKQITTMTTTATQPSAAIALAAAASELTTGRLDANTEKMIQAKTIIAPSRQAEA